ncbi:MAG: hypothetical protein ACLTDR_14930 [Adlercreutzia equolifaciens]
MVTQRKWTRVMFWAHHSLDRLCHRLRPHHGVHRRRHARHAPQARPHRHGGEPEVQRVTAAPASALLELCGLRGVS